MLRKLAFCGRWILTLLFGVTIFLFWLFCYPHVMSYHEQYQLFLFSFDYFLERMTVPGGLADYISEFLVQFYVIEWLGAFILGFLFVLLQRLVWRLMNQLSDSNGCPAICYGLSFVPSVLLLWLMGDENVLLSYVVAILLACGAAALMNGWDGLRKRKRLCLAVDFFLIPCLYWLIGPMAWLYTVLRVFQTGWKSLWMVVWMTALQFVAYYFFLPQWPLKSVLLGLNYYRVPMHYSVIQFALPVVLALIVGIVSFVPPSKRREQSVPKATLSVCGQLLLLAVLCYFGLTAGYDKDKFELIRQDYLIRNERWDEIISRAGSYQVQTAMWSNSVNLALSQKGQLADRMFDFYQSGEDALLMPMRSDLISNMPTAEAFFRLGLVNSAQRYMSDMQESILNGRKSGRMEKRIIECLLINGKYVVARKHIDLLRKSLFYRTWAEEAALCLNNDAKVAAHPVMGRLRRLRFKEDFLFSYAEADKILGRLFWENKENKMALEYFIGQILLNGNIPFFMQSLSWAQQYGNYTRMPLVYQDAVNYVQQQGNVPSSPYGAYVKRMMNMAKKDKQDGRNDTAH